MSDEMLFTEDGRMPSWALARRTDPDTSKAAAVLASERGPNQRVRVFRYFLQHGAGTDFEVSEALSMLRSSCAKRRQELTDLGLVVDSGHRRATDTGVNAIVWRITYQDTADLRGMSDCELQKRFASLIADASKCREARAPKTGEVMRNESMLSSLRDAAEWMDPINHTGPFEPGFYERVADELERLYAEIDRLSQTKVQQ